MARRGFLAELHHQKKVAERNGRRAEAAADREYRAALREEERLRKEEERAVARVAKAQHAERKRLEKEAAKAHQAAKVAEAERRTMELAEARDELATLLAATLDVDDYVDLETLRANAEHPPFDRADLERPLPPTVVDEPPEPVFQAPPEPGGILAIFAKKRHAKALARAKEEHEQLRSDWQAVVSQVALQRQAAEAAHERAESARLAELEQERARYAAECQSREAEAAAKNEALDQLIANLGYGSSDAVTEYIAIVLSNSVYPDRFPVTHEFTFAPETAELQLRVLIPPPDTLSTIKEFKYKKASDEIVPSALPQKACRDIYADAVHQVALRSLHEVFEADRRGIIKTVALEIGTRTIVPATGQEAFILFVATGAERDAFLSFDLSQVMPSATLTHLGASVSKNPYGLVEADKSGVRSA